MRLKVPFVNIRQIQYRMRWRVTHVLVSLGLVSDVCLNYQISAQAHTGEPTSFNGACIRLQLKQAPSCTAYVP